MPKPSCPQKEPLVVEAVRVRADRIEAQVRVSAKHFAYTDSWLAHQGMALLPTLADHACHNEKGSTFGCVIACTSTPHLLEHMAIDLQTRACKNDEAIFTGTTQWQPSEELCALVSLSFKDDLVALNALKQALEILNGWLIERAARAGGTICAEETAHAERTTRA